MDAADHNQLKSFLGNGEIPVESKGKSSFRFKRENDETVQKCIKRIFHLDDSFDEYYRQAIGGSGKEEGKIDSIWSSSLLSLLFFYSAMEKGGIIFNGIHYAKCVFEFQNPVLQNKPYHRYPSNMDCVLMSDDEKQLLFIESKFIEYVRDISKPVLLSENYGKEGESTAELYKWYSDLKPHYYGGAKQMITHYSGLCNFVNHCYHQDMKNDPAKREVITAFENGAEVSFIEIIFDMAKIDKKYEAYRNDYLEFLAELRNHMKNDRFKVLDTITYQQLIAEANVDLPDMIKKYYCF